MKYLILAITTICACFGAFLLTMAGLDYIDPEIGHGLHPLIAFPLATILISTIGVLIALLTSIEDDPDDYDEQLKATRALAKDGIYIRQ